MQNEVHTVSATIIEESSCVSLTSTQNKKTEKLSLNITSFEEAAVKLQNAFLQAG